MMRVIGSLIVLSAVGVVLAQDNATDALSVPAGGDATASPAAAGVSAGADAAAGTDTTAPLPADAPPAATGDAAGGAAEASAGAVVPIPAPGAGDASAGGNETVAGAPADLSGNSVDQEKPGDPAEPGAAAGAPVTPAAVTAPFVPYKFDCGSEADDSGPKCTEWAKSGFCEQHKATKFLFCRKTCLCTGPGGRK
uniref:ShKT domain-containing protein n=1 Tax=Plectus sambesii TaxID=2011161 RepID=A0A914WVS5_9BILA